MIVLVVVIGGYIFIGYSSPTAGPTLTLTASPTTVTAGNPVALTWRSTKATSCNASGTGAGTWSGVEPLSGKAVSSGYLSRPLISTFTIVCRGTSGTATASASVTVTAAVTFRPPTGGTSSGCTYNRTVAPCINGRISGAGASGWGSPAFDDEFSHESTLDTGKWSYGWFTGAAGEADPGPLSGPVSSAEDDCYDPSLVSVSGGYLKLSIRKVSPHVICSNASQGGNAGKGYEGGMITTYDWAAGDGTPTTTSPHFTFSSGFAEARIWLPTAANSGTDGPTGEATGTVSDWPVFWAPGHGEIDIMEGLGGSACWHVHNEANTIDPGGCGSGNFGGGWHTYAAEWTNGSVTFYYDGQDIGTETSAEMGDPTPLADAYPKYLGFSLQTNGRNSREDPATAPAAMYVSYLRVWEN